MKKTITLEQLAAMVDGSVAGNGKLEISGFGSLDGAGPGEISFIVNPRYLEQLEQSSAAAFVVGKEIEVDSADIISVDDAYLASAIIQNYFLEQPFRARGIHASAVVGSDCQISEEVSIGPHAVIGDRAKIGPRVEIGAGVVIGEDVVIGADCRIRANVTIEYQCVLGERVVVHAGSVIGADGYGYATDKRGFHVKRPQLGTVRIEDDVEIGANCCIDRATFGVTWIKSGTKIDNLVQVGHNVVVGENSLLVAQVGLSGSTTLGRNVVLGGKASAAGHQTIGDGTMVAGFSALHGDHPPGSRLAGIPAIDGGQWFKAVTAFSRLPELRKDVRKIKKDLARLEKQGDTDREEE